MAFRDRPPEPSRAVVLRGPGAARVLPALRGAPLVVVEEAGEEEAARALRMGRADVVVSAPADPAEPVEYRLDPSRPEAGIARSRVDDALQRAAGREDPVPFREVASSEPGGRYVDFLVPGLIGMNLMSAGMWGVGYALVDMRIKKLLKRLLATPMRAADFLAALMATRVAVHGRRGGRPPRLRLAGAGRARPRLGRVGDGGGPSRRGLRSPGWASPSPAARRRSRR